MHPKCQKKGHKYEARYDEQPNLEYYKLHMKALEAPLNTQCATDGRNAKLRVYVHDICVGCGDIKRRTNHKGSIGEPPTPEKSKLKYRIGHAIDCRGCKHNDARIESGGEGRPCDFCDFERIRYEGG